MASVSISPKNLPDATLEKSDAGVYTFTVTGLTGIDELPRTLTIEERAAGVVSANPPTVTTSIAEDLPLLMVRAIEVGIDDSLLEDSAPDGVNEVFSRHHYLIAQVTRLTRIAINRLEPPE